MSILNKHIKHYKNVSVCGIEIKLDEFGYSDEFINWDNYSEEDRICETCLIKHIRALVKKLDRQFSGK